MPDFFVISCMVKGKTKNFFQKGKTFFPEKKKHE